MKFEFDRIDYAFGNKPYTLVLNKAATDQYTERLRHIPRDESFLHYILACAASLDRPMKVADIGANVGGTVLPVAAHGVQVLAVEALPPNFICLLTAARENGFTNILPVNMAVYDGPGLVSLSGVSAWAKVNTSAGRPPNMHTAPADTLVAILQSYNFTDVDLIKIDVEGAELAALTGADDFFNSNSHVDVVFECNSHTAPVFGHDQQALIEWFNKRGFGTYILNRATLTPLTGHDVTPGFLLDMLATRKSLAELNALGWKHAPLTEKYLLDSLLAEARNGHKMKIAHIRAQQPYATDSMKRSTTWQEIQSLLASVDAAP
jgi:FkbM family methyltransferase